MYLGSKYISNLSLYGHPSVDLNTFLMPVDAGLPTESHSNTGVLVGAILGSAASVVFVALALFGSYKWWKKRNSVPDYFNERSHNSTGLQVFYTNLKSIEMQFQ